MSSPVSESNTKLTPMNTANKERDTVPHQKMTDEESKNEATSITPSGSDDEAYDLSNNNEQVNEDAPETPSSPNGSIPRMPVVPYNDRSNAIIGTLTESDKKILRLYEENAVIGGPFPVKLQIILKVTEILGQQHIISWLPHGRSFMIHRPREFEEKIMGEFFKQTKLSSFKRQLNLYDFNRVTRGTDCGSYYHEMFLRGKPLLAKRMIRRKIKGTKNFTSSSSNAMVSSNTGDDQDHVPDFYSMPFVGTNRSGLDLQQASRVMNGGAASIPGLDLSNQSVPGHHAGGPVGGVGGAGGMADINASSSIGNRFYRNGLGLPTSHLGSSGAHLSAGALAPPTSAYESLLNRGAAASMNHGAALSGLSSPAAAFQHQNHHDLSLNSLQQLQMNNDLINATSQPFSSAAQLQSYPQQIQSSYAVAMENLNNSYARAANALRRDLDTASSMMTQEELLAARRFNRQVGGGGTLPNSYNFNSKGW